MRVFWLVPLVLVPTVMAAAHAETGTVAPGTTMLGGVEVYEPTGISLGDRIHATVIAAAPVHVAIRVFCQDLISQVDCGSVSLTGQDSVIFGGHCGIAYGSGQTVQLDAVAAREDTTYFVTIQPVASTDSIPFSIALSVNDADPGQVFHNHADLTVTDDGGICEARTTAGLH